MQHPHVATSLNNLGVVAKSQGAYEEARDYQERALAIWEEALGPQHPNLAHPLTGLGQALLGQAHPGEALPHLERALTLRTATKTDPTDLAETRFALARALWDAPADEGSDRPRARSLAELAHTAYAEAGDKSAKELEEVDAWQAKLAD